MPVHIIKIRNAILSTGLLWLIFNGVLFIMQPAMVFFPLKELSATPADWDLSYKSIDILVNNNHTIKAWDVVHPTADKTILFFHGNGGNMSHRGESLLIFHKLGLNTLIIDYPGYGESTGQASEQGIYQAADAAWNHLVNVKKLKPDNIIIFGRSLGGAVAVDLASRVDAAGLILESTFSSVRDMTDIIFPYVSKVMFLRYSFDSYSKLKKIKTPVLMFHSPDDEIIPYELGVKVFESLETEKYFVELQGGHNDGFMLSLPVYMPAMHHFLQLI